MIHSKVAQVVCTFSFLCSLAFGQSMSSNYRSSVSYSMTTTYSVCGTSVAESNCWSTVPNTPSLRQIGVGDDDDMWAIENTTEITGGYPILHFNHSSQGWDTMPGAAIAVAVSDSSFVYALNSSNYVYQWNGSGWTQFPGKMAQISVGQDGDLWGLSYSTNYGCGKMVERYDPSTKSWVAQNFGLTQISVRTQSEVYGVCQPTPNSNIYKWTSSTGWHLVGGWLSQVEARASAAVGITSSANYSDDYVWGIGSGGVLYHMNSDGTFSAITGTPSFIANGRPEYVYGLFGGVLKHYQSQALTITNTVSGNGNCLQSGGCGTVQHTGRVSLQVMAGSHTLQTNQQNYLWSSNMNVPVSDTLTPMESFDCVFGEQGSTGNCPNMQTDATVTCPLAGLLFSNPFDFPISVRLPYEKVKTLNPGTGGSPAQCQTTAWCANTNNPLCPVTLVMDTGKVCRPYYRCVSLAITSGSTTECYGPGAGLGGFCIGTSDSTKGQCSQ